MVKGRIVDLSHKLIPGKEEYKLELETYDTTELYPQYQKDKDTWYILQEMHMFSHCGTHIEFPFHHNREGMDASEFPLERLVSETVLLDFTHKKPGEFVELEELRGIEDKIRPGDTVLFNFNCARFYRTKKSHSRPILSHDAAGWLIAEKKINIIGSDASGIELKGVPNQPNHQLLMDNGIPIIEFAANLGALRKERFTLFVLALNVVGLDSCPVRLIGLEDE
jgi:arylformamidase